MQDPNVKTQTTVIWGRPYLYDQSKISRLELTEIITAINTRDWKDKKDKEFAIQLVARAVR